MGIIVGNDTRLVVAGITGREGSFHALNNRRYGTQVVAGVTPGKGGQDVEGVPVFNMMEHAVKETGANTAMIFVPPPFAADSIYEAVDAGVKTVICITEGIPAHDMLLVYGYVKSRGVTLVGPNCPGVCTVGEANVGIMPAHIFTPGTVGLVSRSGTLTYQLGKELTDMGIGQSTILGIGGDPIVGTNHRDALALFEADPGTDMIVMVGEIGGDEEERAADFIRENVTKPVIGYIAGLTAPEGKQMGHAGAIISGNAGTAAGKVAALEAAGVKVGENPTAVARLVAEARGVAVPA
jgi:succinyl-CoA synthetase alpha subunit